MSALGNFAQQGFRHDNQLWNVSILPTGLSPLDGSDRVSARDDTKTQKYRREAKAERLSLTSPMARDR